ncbi:MAG: DUF6550 family protein [Acetatifactor sp.]
MRKAKYILGAVVVFAVCCFCAPHLYEKAVNSMHGPGEEPFLPSEPVLLAEQTEAMASEVEEPEVEDIEPEVTETREITAEPIEIEITPKSQEDVVQSIQPDPEVPDPPTEPPTLKENEDVTNPDKKPEYDEETKPDEKPTPPKEKVETKPKDDGDHPGQVYVIGFGWVDYLGPNETIYAHDMYMNGNKIGDM